MMNKGKVFSLRRMHSVRYLVKNKVIFLLLLLFVFSLLFGVVFFSKNSSAQQTAKDLCEQYIAHRTHTRFWTVFFKTLGDSFLLMVFAFFIGSSLFGMVSAPLYIGYCGFWFGTMSAYLYATYALKGIAFYAIAVLPAAVVFLMGLLFAAKESILFSFVVAKQTLPKSVPTGLYHSFKNYCVRYVGVALLGVASSVLDALLSVFFLKNFTLN